MCKVWGLGFRLQGLGLGWRGSGFRVRGFGTCDLEGGDYAGVMGGYIEIIEKKTEITM